MTKTERKYDLEERTALFGEPILEELKPISQECQELIFIFQKIASSSRNSSEKVL